jgi:hypothetical protein
MLLPFQIKAMTLLRLLCAHTAQVCCPCTAIALLVWYPQTVLTRGLATM